MPRLRARRLAPLALLLVGACHPARRPATPAPVRIYQEGIASWYGPGFAGRPTASGETFDPGALTAAHRELPFGTRVRVLNMDNGREVTVRINDRGPNVKGRIIDLSRAAAEVLDFIREGTARVRLLLEDDRPPSRS